MTYKTQDVILGFSGYSGFSGSSGFLCPSGISGYLPLDRLTLSNNI